MIKRNRYIDKLISFKDKEVIKVVTGIRRCGKSTLFKLFQNYLIETGVEKSQIININFEDIAYEYLTDYKVLYEKILEQLIPDKMNYIFLDEIQNVEKFEKAVNSLFIKENVDIYITGSNAFFLSGELATVLSGRYVEILMLPLSFKEYASALPDDLNNDRKFSKYLHDGGFPYLLSLDDEQAKQDYLQGIYNTIVLKDIVQRKKITDVTLLESIIKFMFDNVGNTTSPKKVSDTLTSYGKKVSVPTVESYLTALCDSFILNKIYRYDVAGKQLLKTQNKYYVTDLGVQRFLLSNYKQNIGHNIENIIFLELKRRGFKVYIGKVDDLEIDFVAEGYGKKYYYQVAQTVADEKTLSRELRPLEKIRDNHPKILLSMDILPETSYNGIQFVNIVDWLLAE